MISLILGIIGSVLGVVSFFVCWWLAIIGLILGILAIFFAFSYEYKEIGKLGTANKILSITSTCVNTISLLLFVILLLIIA